MIIRGKKRETFGEKLGEDDIRKIG